jgi:hypothetical protein
LDGTGDGLGFFAPEEATRIRRHVGSKQPIDELDELAEPSHLLGGGARSDPGGGGPGRRITGAERDLDAPGREMIDGNRRPGREDGRTEEQARHQRPDADLRCPKGHRRERGGPVEQGRARPIRLHNRVHVPDDVEAESLGTLPTLEELVEREVLVLVHTESDGRHAG